MYKMYIRRVGFSFVGSELNASDELPGLHVDPSQIRRRCDHIALRTQFAGAERSQPTLLAVDMPAANRHNRYPKLVHADQALAFIVLPLRFKLSDFGFQRIDYLILAAAR